MLFMLLLEIFLERGRKLIAAGSPKKPAFWGALQVVDVVDSNNPCCFMLCQLVLFIFVALTEGVFLFLAAYIHVQQ